MAHAPDRPEPSRLPGAQADGTADRWRDALHAYRRGPRQAARQEERR